VKAAVVVAGVLLVAACGAKKTETPGASGACDTSKGTLSVGVIAPLSGDLTALGKGIENAASLAVDQANEKCTVKGYKLVLDANDDEATPAKGQQAATKLSSNPNVLGVVGTLNSSVAQSVQPVLAAKKIVQISPANTNPALTRGTDFLTAPKRQFDTYFRVCATDDLQGPFAADYLVTTAGKKKIAIITDGKTYGKGLAAEFKKRATAKGAAVVAEETVGEKDTDFTTVLTKIKPSTPDAIYYGGEYPAAGPLSKQAAAQGLNVPLMGGDGIYDPKFISLGGKDGDFATSIGAPTDQVASAKAFVDAYNAKKYKDSYSAYGAFSYDAANVIIAAAAQAIADGTWSDTKRADVLKNVAAYDKDGANGKVSFDQYGDSTNKVLTVYQVKGTSWSAAKTGTFTP
jgi:branched-chain amino acid transport system substrate-binding protein